MLRVSALLATAVLVTLLTPPTPPSSPSSIASVVVDAAATSGSIPRSTSHRLSLSDPDIDGGGASDTEGSGGTKVRHPPWNRSPRIDPDGFLSSAYGRIPGEWEPEADIGGRHGPSSKSYRSLRSGSSPPSVVRQVPGDGNCLFHSVSAALARASDGEHPPLCTTRGLRNLRKSSAELRRRAVECLSRDPRRRLFLQGRETLRAGELVDAAAAQYGLSGEEYCEQMGRDSYWGGGPEIVALCNVLRRPIHVYELCSVDAGDGEEGNGSASSADDANALCAGDDSPELSDDKHKNQATRRTVHPQFRLRRMACFGSPRYDRREPLHILSADSRFPDVSPGRQLPTGNHFLAMFPEPKKQCRKKKRQGGREELTRRPRKVRGGGGGASAARERAKAKKSCGRAATPHRNRWNKSVVAPKRIDDEDEDNLFGRIGRWVNRMDRSGGGPGGKGVSRRHGNGGCTGSGNEGPREGLAASLMERWLDLLGRILALI